MKPHAKGWGSMGVLLALTTIPLARYNVGARLRPGERSKSASRARFARRDPRSYFAAADNCGRMEP